MDEMSNSLPADKETLMEGIRRERAALEELINKLSKEQMITPGPEGWSVKDHLAHLVTWEQILLIHHLKKRPFAEAAAMDETTATATAEMTAESGLNDFFFDRDQDRPLEEVLADFQESHRRILAALEEMSYEDLMAPYQEDEPLLRWVRGNTDEHYQEHRIIIERIIQARG